MRGEDDLGKTEEKDEKNSWGPGEEIGRTENCDLRDFVLRREEKILGVRDDDLGFFDEMRREDLGGES